MKLTEARLRQIVLEEVHMRLVEELVEEEFFKLLLEQDDDISDEEYLELWRKKPSFREKVKDAFDNFDAIQTISKFQNMEIKEIIKKRNIKLKVFKLI